MIIDYECSNFGPYTCNTTYIQEILDPRVGVVCLNGGGNFGDVWWYVNDCRQQYVTELPNYKFVLFPQSIYYKNISNSQRTAELYASRDMTLAARDRGAFQLLEKYFPSNPRLLIPDMAFMIGPLHRLKPTVDIFWLLRLDLEANLNRVSVDYLLDLLPPELKGKITMDIDDWDKNGDVKDVKGLPTDRAQLRFNDAVQTLCRGKVVVSDRLHSHIISTLLDIPHVLIDNNIGKVFNFHKDWTSDLENVYTATDHKEALHYALKLLFQSDDDDDDDDVVVV